MPGHLQQSQCEITSVGCVEARVSTGWEPRAGGKADVDTSGVSHPEGKCSVSCLRR